jgi:aldose 1-epimerase
MSSTANVKPGDSAGLLRLARDPLELWLAPSVGGCITVFNHHSEYERKIPVLRGAAAVPDDILDAACFPLVPFSNRIRNGCFRFRGREVTLTPNMKGDPSPLHGQGWRSSWEVVGQGESEAELRFRHDAGEWPWDYEARQVLRLDRKGLSLRLSCRNLSDEPMPCGLGLHPYFPCTPETRLDARVECAWTVDDETLPVEKVPAQGRFNLTNRSACG